jgi:hypothetical protein
MNKLLERQIKRIIGDIETVPPALEKLFQAISDAYDGFDADRRLIEHALDLSSAKKFRKKLKMPSRF